LCTDLDLSLLYILILGTYSKFARKNNFLALGVCFPQPCSSTGRMFAASRSRFSTTDESFRFHNKNFDEMHCKLDFTENRIRSRNTQPHLNVPPLKTILPPSICAGGWLPRYSVVCLDNYCVFTFTIVSITQLLYPYSCTMAYLIESWKKKAKCAWVLLVEGVQGSKDL